ncbi:hypothetical protein COW46_05095 [Candidatus Gracilibacteria bacterium CG17_big_fil_post_rev_8_21_14_2_50_48_13]|nr:MAG: hypothetical protein COW46_05095 [Candidatus Gracilibacteria bacterium CG17_big_fil_post_rev_8_21_14_2_50_48_13]
MNTQVLIRIDPIEEKPNFRLVTLSGQVDESNLHMVEEQLETLVNHDDVRVLVFNFRDLEFINSRVIGYLLSIYSSMAEADKRMAIVESNQNIMSILSLVGLTTLIGHYGNLSEALEVLE